MHEISGSKKLEENLPTLDAEFTPGDWENRPDFIDVGYAKIRIKPPKWVFAHNPRGSVLSLEAEEYAVL